IGGKLFQRSKSAATGDSQSKCQNGYRAAEGDVRPLVSRNQINCNSQSPSKNSIKRWYEIFKETKSVQYRKRARRSPVSDKIVERVRETKRTLIAHIKAKWSSVYCQFEYPKRKSL
ncbi:hypothetical protein AVEN_91620-1, partial [Araneus ventricosus]